MNEITVLDNKLRIVTSEMPHMESVSIGLFTGVGGRYEEREVCGVSHFIEHMLFKGTLSRDARELKQAIEGIGGHFNGFTSEELTCYLVKVPAKHTPIGLDIISDMVLHPKMEYQEIEKERQVITEEIKMYRDQPSSYVFELLAEMMWPGHALGRPLTGYEDTVKAIDRQAMMAVKERYYCPSNMAVVATGKINTPQFVKAVTKIFKHAENAKTPVFSAFREGQKEKQILIHEKVVEQTHLNIWAAICLPGFSKN